MLFKAIPASVVALLKEIHLLPLPSDTYLAGGTAVALYLGHRISVDIDLFTEKEFYSGPIISSFKERYKVEVVSTAEKDTFITNINKVRLSLFRYPYPLLEPTNYNPDLKVYIASQTDTTLATKKVTIYTEILLSCEYCVEQNLFPRAHLRGIFNRHGNHYTANATLLKFWPR